MGIHQWIDLGTGLGLIAVTVIAAVLSSRLSRHDAERAEERQERREHGEKLNFIEGLLRGAGIWK